MTTTAKANTLQVRDLREGMLVHTKNGKSAIRCHSRRQINGAERHSISLANGLVYTNLRPHDKVLVG